MKHINSVSGGRTSAYLAANYPAHENIFMLVCINDVSCKPKDHKIIQYVNDKLEKSGTITHGEFIATAEFDQVLYTVMELEQYIGKEITWLRGVSFDDLIDKRKMVPYKLARFCTSAMKIDVIGNYLSSKMDVIDGVPQKFMNNVGIRWDEDRRVKEGDERIMVTKIHNGYSKSGRNRWKDVAWGVANYPLVEDKVTHFTVHKFWRDKPVTFSDDSNCVGCFWKPIQQLRKNWEDAPEKMEWFSKQEKKRKDGRWKNEITYDKIKKIALQKDFFFGTGSGCNAGFCTD